MQPHHAALFQPLQHVAREVCGGGPTLIQRVTCRRGLQQAHRVAWAQRGGYKVVVDRGLLLEYLSNALIDLKSFGAEVEVVIHKQLEGH